LESEFPYRETDDQRTAIEAVMEDLESAHPMDRLVCGDVGFGKTEVALRAAFAVAVNGKQVLMLVPTTVLAQQHWNTFRNRYRDYPVRVEMVSRFRRPSDVKKVLADFKDGKVEVLIGTHRVLSRDVIPKELGLVMVDEEQRFGVAQKELLRQLRLEVDVLALSATPIPRTLHMSLAGLRDISVIETPPEGRRPIRTFVGEYDEELVKQALERELNREGQAFYLHNRVETIDEAAEKVAQLCPKARVLVAHGQMKERELEDKMLAFLGAGDLLGAEQSGRVAALGFELYVEMLHEVVAELTGQRRLAARPVRVDARVDAYVPASYIASEALKIDLHRRLALVEDEDELRELERATEDRYGPLPGPVENLFTIQDAKLKLAVLGADYLVFRSGRASVGPMVLGSGELRSLREQIDTAVYTTAKREVSLRHEELGGALRLLDAMLAARQAA